MAQKRSSFPSATAGGRVSWGGFTWGPPPGTVWGSTAPANPPRFTWGTDPWSGPAVTWNYFTLDHLGSVAVITDQGGNVVQRLSYDAWGKQRNADGSDTACGSVTAPTTRGYTNQEQMPAPCLVNLNARLYDPSIGKFMAADSMVPQPFDGQSYNRYAYVTNNPLSFTDPTGHDFGSVACGLSSYCGSIVYYVPGGGTTNSAQDAGYANGTAPANSDSASFNNQPLANPNQQDQTQGGVRNNAGDATDGLQASESVTVSSVRGNSGPSSWAVPDFSGSNVAPASPDVEQVTVTAERIATRNGVGTNGGNVQVAANTCSMVAAGAGLVCGGAAIAGCVPTAGGGCAIAPAAAGVCTAAVGIAMGGCAGSIILQNQSKTPNSGEPGTWHTNPGSGQQRLYGPDGKPVLDIDRDHSHGGADIPHAHDWTPSPNPGGFPVRGEPRPLNPDDPQPPPNG